MSDYSAEYKKWLSFKELDSELRTELEQIREDENEIKERFSKPLSFGTAGLRGIIRAGINGMNIYTVSQATKGLCELVKKENGKKSVVIACDTRIKSDVFSKISACVLAANGIKAYIFDSPRPTPELSFALRYLGADAGINITASHNPKEYNGYKAYWKDGAQISPEQAKIVSDEIGKTDIFEGAQMMDFDEGIQRGMIEIIGGKVDEAYINAVLGERIYKNAIPDVADTFKVVYTPFHGTGAVLVPEVLKRAGLKHLYTVKEQMIPDGTFPTVKSPNPENKEGFYLAEALAKENDCDLIIGTDPDSDRAGIVVRASDGKFVCLTGNQTGVLLLSYIIEARKLADKLPSNAAAVKSIVSTGLADEICKRNGVELVNVLTGFKYIGEKITEYETTGEKTYIFGFEESYGYLTGTYARDKDAVCASMLIAEMAAYYYKKGLTLYDVLQNVFSEYGFYKESTDNIYFAGLDGIEKMTSILENLRNNLPGNIAGESVKSVADYKTGKITSDDGKTDETGLPKTNMLIFTLESGDRVIIRPSGTEPKVKIYYLAHAKTEKEADEKVKNCSEYMKKLLGV